MKIYASLDQKKILSTKGLGNVYVGNNGDKLYVCIDKQNQNWRPIIRGTMSNGKSFTIGQVDVSGYSVDDEDNSFYSFAFTLSYDNGVFLTAGKTEFEIWIQNYTTDSAGKVTDTSRYCIGKSTCNVITSSYEGGDFTIFGKVDSAYQNLLSLIQQMQANHTNSYTNVSATKLEVTGDFLVWANNNGLKFTNTNTNYPLAVVNSSNQLVCGVNTQGQFVVAGVDGGIGTKINTLIGFFNSNGYALNSVNSTTAGSSTHAQYDSDETGTTKKKFSEKYLQIEDANSNFLKRNESTTNTYIKGLFSEATKTLAGLMSAQDKENLDTLVNLLEDSEKTGDGFTNTIREIMNILSNYPEGTKLLDLISTKANKSDLVDGAYKVEKSVHSDSSDEAKNYITGGTIDTRFNSVEAAITLINRAINLITDNVSITGLQDQANSNTNRIVALESHVNEVNKVSSEKEETIYSKTFSENGKNVLQLNKIGGLSSVNNLITSVSSGELNISNIQSVKIVGANLFDKSKEVVSVCLDNTGGTYTSSLNNSSDYIEIKPNTNLYFTNVLFYNFYSEMTSSSFISQHTNTEKVSPSNARYIRITYSKSNVDSAMVSYTDIEYQPYKSISQSIEIEKYNLWDEQWELGTINSSGAVSTSANQLVSKNFVKVYENTTYYAINNDNTYSMYLFAYNSNKEFISAIGGKLNTSFTTPTNCAYIKFYVNGHTTYNNDIAIVKGSTGFYVPHNSIEHLGYSVSTTQYNYIDCLRSKAVIKFGIVDLGSLTWSKHNISYYPNGAYFSTISNLKSQSPNAIIAGFNYGDIQNDKEFLVGKNNTIQIGYYNTNVTDIKTLLSGVYLIYELETPIELDVYNLPSVYEVNKGDTIIFENANGVALPVKYSLSSSIKTQVEKLIVANTEQQETLNLLLDMLLSINGVELG